MALKFTNVKESLNDRIGELYAGMKGVYNSVFVWIMHTLGENAGINYEDGMLYVSKRKVEF